MTTLCRVFHPVGLAGRTSKSESKSKSRAFKSKSKSKSLQPKSKSKSSKTGLKSGLESKSGLECYKSALGSSGECRAAPSGRSQPGLSRTT